MNREELTMKLLKKADPSTYNKRKCEEILQKTDNINLPRLEASEITNMKKSLTGYVTKPTEDLIEKFLQLRNAFLIINENNPGNTKIKQIIKYLEEYQYIFQQKKDPYTPKETHKQTLNILGETITKKFIIKYEKINEDTENTYEEETITPENQTEEEN